MKHLIVNFVAVMVIGMGGFMLTQPTVTQAETVKTSLFLDAECECANGSSCSGQSCECTDEGCTADADDRSWLEKIFG